MKKCKRCGEVKENKQFGQVTDSRYKTGYYLRPYCRKCASKIRVEAKRKQKIKWDTALKTICKLECSVCGFNMYIEALDFHHLNPKEKEFSISDYIFQYTFTKERFKKLKREIAKTVLVCSNCHRGIHAKKLSLDLCERA